MVKSLAVGFGLVTALAVAGSMTPVGQGMLGQRHSTEQAAPVSTIQDRPVAIPAPSQSLVSAPAAQRTVPAPAPVAPPAGSRGAQQHSQAAPAGSRPPVTAPRASQPQAGQPGQPQGGPGGIAGIANILLNLPQVLDQTRVGPSHGPDSWSQSRPGQGGQDSAKPHGRRNPQDGQKRPQKEESGDNNSGN